MIGRKIIEEMASMIVEQFRPEKIILFGSYARGDAGECSDIDLLVVMDTDLPKPKRSAPMYSLLRDYPYSKDILVYNADEVREYVDLPMTLMHRIFSEGVVLYER